MLASRTLRESFLHRLNLLGDALMLLFRLELNALFRTLLNTQQCHSYAWSFTLVVDGVTIQKRVTIDIYI